MLKLALGETEWVTLDSATKFLCSNTLEKAPITKTRLYDFDPLKPHFYVVKLGFTGVYIIFLISAQKLGCGYSLEPPRRGGSNGCSKHRLWVLVRTASPRRF